MYCIVYDIKIGDSRVNILNSAEINLSVDQLAATAQVVLPLVEHNRPLDYEGYIAVGDKVTIMFGYNDELQTEFTGYVKSIGNYDSVLKVNCEDCVYMTRKPVEDTEFPDRNDPAAAGATIREIAQYCMTQVGLGSVDCDYEMTYQKFVIRNNTAFEILSKLKDETGAMIYMKGDVLHIHPPFSERSGEVTYDFEKNIESADLKDRSKAASGVYIEISGTNLDGEPVSATAGNPKGDKKSNKLEYPIHQDEISKVAKTKLEYLAYDGYEGSITGWLEPFVQPTWAVKLVDPEKVYTEGTYYVNSVKTTISSAGGVRKVELGKKL